MSKNRSATERKQNKTKDLHAERNRIENIEEGCLGHFLTTVNIPTTGLFEIFSYKLKFSHYKENGIVKALNIF